MNMIEHLFMQAAGELCQKMQRASPEENKLANVEALDVLKKIDPDKLQGLVVMGIQSCEPGPNGEPGYELISSMIGSPELIRLLAEGVKVFTKMHQMNEMFKQVGACGDPLIEAILGGSAVEGGAVKERYNVPEGVTKQ